jgi:phage gp46-like protein
MPDIRVVQFGGTSGEAVTLDWALTPAGQLDDGDQLQSALIVALGTDRQANPDDELPTPAQGDEPPDLRGWWGDLDAEDIWSGWPIGVRLWLLARAKMTDQTAREGSIITRCQAYLHEAIQPFVTAGVASSCTVQVTRNSTDANRLDALVTLYRGSKAAIQLRFQDLWTAITQSSPPAFNQAAARAAPALDFSQPGNTQYLPGITA